MAIETPSAEFKVTTVSDAAELMIWLKGMFEAFVGTDNVLADTLMGLAPGVPPSDLQLEKALIDYRKDLEEPQADRGKSHYIQILDPETQEVMGGAKWTFFSSTPVRKEKLVVDWIDDSDAQGKFDKEFTQAVIDEHHGRRYEHMAFPHGLLQICYASPAYERRGVASALVKWGLEKADKEGWPCITEASPRGKQVYARLGFDTREEVALRWDERGDCWRDKGTLLWTFMERPGAQGEVQ
jgi:GNAT superfamily N-acetyltransferase